MNGKGKWIWILLAAAVVVVLHAKNAEQQRAVSPSVSPATEPAANASAGVVSPVGKSVNESAIAAALPRLVDLGAGKCIPCKMMAPILEDLKQTQAGRLNVEFIDVWQTPEAGKPYGINVIPTQIFYDAAGKELFRHEGFFSKEDILAKWKEFGVDLGS